MITFDELKKELRTEDGIIQDTQEQTLKLIDKWLHSHGYLSAGFKNYEADTNLKRWVWGNGYGVEVIISNPRFRDAKFNRKDPEEKSREPKTADTFTIKNASDVPIKQVLDQTFKVDTNASTSKTDTFGISVTAGLSIGVTTGVSGQATNGGSTGLTTAEANLSTTFDANFVRNWVESKGASTSKTIKQEIELAPGTQYKLDVMIDEIDLSIDLESEGVLDFDIEIDFSKRERNGNEQPYRKASLKASSIRDLARRLIGVSGDHIQGSHTIKHDLLHLIESMIETEYRKVKTTTTLEYSDAGAIWVEVERVGKLEVNKDD